MNAQSNAQNAGVTTPSPLGKGGVSAIIKEIVRVIQDELIQQGIINKE